ncbi:MAG: NAD(P)/FAD-dependent oxidoreductase [Chloroflexi bacterium]|nr:NAD(P)/FAD-dependent oxidoreductase [Chloroflexota bacterium]
MTRFVDVLIVGAGPAGMSTALHLCRLDLSWADRILVVEKAVHPREKLCGGGITQAGLQVLAGLGLSTPEPFVAVREARLRYFDGGVVVRDEPVFHVVRRAEFDHWLVKQAQARGVEVRQGEGVVDVIEREDGVEVRTEQAAYRARVVVAADGSNSLVRRRLGWRSRGGKARLLEILTPEQAEALVEFQQGMAVFDFTPASEGLQGYYWDFPSLVAGEPFMNRGVYDSRTLPHGPRVALREVFAAMLARRNRRLHDYALKGHPIHWFDRGNALSRPRILLVGDAAGVDPLFGEGISFALAYGEVAAEAIAAAFARGDFRFEDYTRRVHRHPWLRKLPQRKWVAVAAYRVMRHPRLAGLFWAMAPWVMTTYNRARGLLTGNQVGTRFERLGRVEE